MKKHTLIAALSGCMLTLSACSAKVQEPAATAFEAGRIKADMAFLADDLLEGRKVASEGHELAARYVAAAYARAGLKPVGDGGSYFQQVPFVKASLVRENTSVTLTANGTAETLTFADDYQMRGSSAFPKVDVAGDLVFAGFGVHAPSLGHDDLEGLDVKGKIVVLIADAPKGFHSEVRAYQRSNAVKGKELAKRGAVAMVTIRTPAENARFGYDRYLEFVNDPSFDWVRPEGSGEAQGLPSLLLSPAMQKRLFAAAGVDLDPILAAVDAGTDKVAPVDLGLHLAIKAESKASDPVTSPNVLGLLEGSDPELAHEVVVMSAHLDHKGVKEDEGEGRKVYNGALDNAAGISTLLEVARVWKESGLRPRRSVLFAAVTAEEEGLQGSDYLAHFPPAGYQMVANVNLDMPILLFDFADVNALGGERSDLGPIVEAAVAKAGLALSPDPLPNEGRFTRSDQFRFVQRGVPAVALKVGISPAVDGADSAALTDTFMKNIYHKPSDTMDQPIHFDAAAKFARVNWLIANEIANRDAAPQWNAGDYFGGVFEKQD
ncbi:M28 family metallopeptidase [Pseudokordiimonas caeni]|uniref:M28 family metallopeptidase n=1 Tax=Pseudokordiimonas caeni TaxID=2997908 RepID=UPI002811BD6C|nr:M28 family peptidase [Pseudokordiimonas caeni]